MHYISINLEIFNHFTTLLDMNEQDKKQEQIKALQEQGEHIDWAVVVLC